MKPELNKLIDIPISTIICTRPFRNDKGLFMGVNDQFGFFLPVPMGEWQAYIEMRLQDFEEPGAFEYMHAVSCFIKDYKDLYICNN